MAKFEDLLRAAEQTDICVSGLPGFTKPRQRRTHTKTNLMVASAAYLLQDKPFSEISIQDIASGAGCAVTSIYARFDDKMALLQVVRLIILKKHRQMMSTRLNPDLFGHVNITVLATEFVNATIDFFEENKHFFRATITNEVNHIYGEIAESTEQHAKDLALAVSGLIGRDQYSVAGSLAFAMRAIVSICRDGVVGGLQFEAYDRLAFAQLFAMILDQDVGGGA